jgi:hypothetical protein
LFWRTLVAAVALVVSAGVAQAQVAEPGSARLVPSFNLGIPDVNLLVRPPTQHTPYDLMAFEEGPLSEFAPNGTVVGDFTLFPSLTIEPGYNSNVFATPSDVKGDGFVTMAPELIAVERSPRDTLDVEVNAEINKFFTQTSQDNTNFSFGVGNGYEIDPGVLISAGASYEILHEDPAAELTVATQPTEYHVATGYLGFLQRPDRFGYRIEGTVSHYDYNSLQPVGGGPSISQTDQNYTYLNLVPTAYYQLTPTYTLFSRLSLNSYVYDLAKDFNGFNRNSYGGAVDFGTVIDITRELQGTAAAGVLYQKYEDSAFNDVVGPEIDIALAWTPEENELYGLHVTRSVQQSFARTEGTETFSATVTAAQVSADYLPEKNIVLHADAEYTRYDYQGASRTDQGPDARVNAMYFINRYLSTGPEFRYVQRFSDDPTARFTRFEVLYRVTAHY